MITLNDVYRNSGQITEGLIAASQKVLETSRNKGDSVNLRDEALEGILQTLLYEQNSQYNEEFQRSMTSLGDSLIAEIDKRLNDISVRKVKSEALKTITSDTEQTKRASLHRANQLIQTIENTLAELKNTNSNDLPPVIKRLKRNVSKIKTSLSDLENKYGEERRFYLTYKDGDDFRTLYANLALLHKYVEVLTETPTAKRLGDAFENILLKAFQQEIEKGTNGIIQEFAKQLQSVAKYGNIKVSRTAATGGQLLSVSLDYETLGDMGKDVSKFMKEFSDGSKSYQITYKPQDKNYSKMDIQLNFGEGTLPANLSLKNWANLISSNELYGIAESALMDILVREVGLELTNMYMYALLSTDSGSLNIAHNLAKISIAADLVMGLAQENNWANKLVINDRSRSKVYVLNVPALIKTASKKSSLLNINNYQSKGLEGTAKEMFERLGMTDRSKEYVSHMGAALRSQIVSIKLSQGLVQKLVE